MTTKEFSDLLARREAAWEELGVHPVPLRDLPPSKRERMDRASTAFREADAAITAELARRNQPARVGEVELHLTADQLGWAVVDPATGKCPHGDAWPRKNYRATALLYRYPARPA